MTPETVKIVPPPKHRKSASIESGKMQKLKRKRADSGGAGDSSPRAPPPKKINQQPQVISERPYQPIVAVENDSADRTPGVPKTQVPAPKPHLSTSTDNAATSSVSSSAQEPQPQLTSAQLEKLKSTLHFQFNTEILLKHKELRLIDQELAKCQIALEQLRRCFEIPYPAARLSQDVANGTGSALRSNLPIQPESPAPWGVTDGPYSRHYAKWLLPDPRFDGAHSFQQPASTMPAGKFPTKGRSTRGSFTEVSVGSSSRTGRGKESTKMQALPSGYPQPRDKSGPMIQKRKSDGAMVKLICLDCRRDNFSSAQGFINHCRIAHGRSFASHDAAADACGEPVEMDEAGAVIGGDVQGTAGLVHPLIRSAHLLKKSDEAMAAITNKVEVESKTTQGEEAGPSAIDVSSTPKVDEAAIPKRKRGRKVKETAAPIPSTFKPSSLTPNLSALMSNRGSVLDLEDIVGDARAPTDFQESSSSESESDDESATPETTPGRVPLRGSSMQPLQASNSLPNSERPGSRKGMPKDHKPSPLGNLPPVLPRVSATPVSNRQMDGAGDVLDVEPSPTNDSNQAPSLVSDDEEYENHSGSETSSSTSGSNGDLDVEVEDDESTSGGGPSTRSSAEDSEFSSTAKEGQAGAPKRASAFRRSLGKREEKHVSFVSPSPVREDVKKKGGRRRKTQ